MINVDTILNLLVIENPAIPFKDCADLTERQNVYFEIASHIDTMIVNDNVTPEYAFEFVMSNEFGHEDIDQKAFLRIRDWLHYHNDNQTNLKRSLLNE